MQPLLMMFIICLSTTALVLAAGAAVQAQATRPEGHASSLGFRLDEIKLPPGFKIKLFATAPNAREKALGDKGTLFVGSRCPLSAKSGHLTKHR